MASIFGVQTVEEPKFELVKKCDGYEIRKYPNLIIAEVQMENADTGTAFRKLAGFIFGKNVAPSGSSTKVAMTAPVIMAESKMKFVMPAQYDEASLPKPTNPEVAIKRAASETLAVITYSGFGESNREEHEGKLRGLLARDGVALAPGAAFRLCQYNPPWTLPFLRRNEVMVPVLLGA